jgi:hypothetical protein
MTVVIRTDLEHKLRPSPALEAAALDELLTFSFGLAEVDRLACALPLGFGST